MDEQEQKYIDGFNSGYLLAKHEPTLAAQITSSPNEHNPFFSGLVSGKAEYEREVREWAKGFSRGGPVQDDRDKNRDR
ncbi:hypothetical protein [Mucilaginibacter paludis]|uniref:Uncharacterized protein n=1 Tax=Mucilaginibacter paludis DSM 18603 TaxID=714943 RepID=H1Y3L3_9SPHI|nr:hypothetical protein [Mucilaginibacter paludis]EHQ29781.1 hypothetical protein Mucpa_5712 [Mucilaginibacter paludis DSM 18603]